VPQLVRVKSPRLFGPGEDGGGEPGGGFFVGEGPYARADDVVGGRVGVGWCFGLGVELDAVEEPSVAVEVVEDELVHCVMSAVNCSQLQSIAANWGICL
jgi:hypothetical protein